jgi:hypothetical protein
MQLWIALNSAIRALRKFKLLIRIFTYATLGIGAAVVPLWKTIEKD